MEINFGVYALPVILTVVLGLFYKTVGPGVVPDRFKAIIACGVGIGLGVVSIPYNGLPWTVKIVVDACLTGFMYGASAVGIYEVTRTVTKPRG